MALRGFSSLPSLFLHLCPSSSLVPLIPFQRMTFKREENQGMVLTILWGHQGPLASSEAASCVLSSLSILCSSVFWADAACDLQKCKLLWRQVKSLLSQIQNLCFCEGHYNSSPYVLWLMHITPSGIRSFSTGILSQLLCHSVWISWLSSLSCKESTS